MLYIFTLKGLEKDQGQLEHANKPGSSIDTFTQADLNKGLVLYYSPKEIGTVPRDFLFTFVVTNDHRSDTFPETPFHVRVLPSNDQAPSFKSTVSSLEIQSGGSLILPRDLFDVEDPDTSLENLIFTVEKAPDSLVIELRSKGQRYVISKDDSFNMQEIRDGTFRLVHNSHPNHLLAATKDSFKLSASDNKHISMKTVNVNVRVNDQLAPQPSNRSSLLLSVREAQVKSLRRENLAFYDEHSTSEEIVYKLVNGSIVPELAKLSGKLFKKKQWLSLSDTFTQADVDLQNVRYEAPSEIGANMLTDTFYFDVSDKEGNTNRMQMFTVKVEPLDNQAPIVDILQPVGIFEAGYLLFNESLIQIRDIDSAKEQLNVIIDSQPSFGYFENSHKG